MTATQQQLPPFEGERIDLASLHIYGSPEDAPQVPYRMGQSVYAVVRLRVTAVEHKTKNETTTRMHKLAVEELYEVGLDEFEDAASAARLDSGQPTLLDGDGRSATISPAAPEDPEV